MRTLRGAVWATALVALCACDPEVLIEGSLASRAEKRVRGIFETVSREGESTSMEYQTAICRWWKDRVVIDDMGEFSWAYDEFDEFKRQGSLAKGFRFEIDGSEQIEGSIDREVLVRGTVDGSRFELVVPEGKAIRWKLAPRPRYG